MSTYGTYRLRLSRQRLAELRRQQEEARKQQVRQEVSTMLAKVQAAAGQFQHHMTQVFGQKAQQETADLARQARQRLQSDPDQALKLARRSLLASQRGLKQASKTAAAWSHSKAQAEEAVGLLKLAVDGLLQGASVVENDDSSVRAAVADLAEASAALLREDFARARTAAARGQDQVLKAEQERRDREHTEAVRREIVHGLREVLVELGFAVERPCRNNDKVNLVGRLPSGRIAMFSISLDGQVRYDFDGYSRGGCGKDRLAIRKWFESRCNAQVSEEAYHLKDEEPIRFASGSRDLPAADTRHLG